MSTSFNCFRHSNVTLHNKTIKLNKKTTISTGVLVGMLAFPLVAPTVQAEDAGTTEQTINLEKWIAEYEEASVVNEEGTIEAVEGDVIADTTHTEVSVLDDETIELVRLQLVRELTSVLDGELFSEEELKAMSLEELIELHKGTAQELSETAILSVESPEVTEAELTAEEKGTDDTDSEEGIEVVDSEIIGSEKEEAVSETTEVIPNEEVETAETATEEKIAEEMIEEVVTEEVVTEENSSENTEEVVKEVVDVKVTVTYIVKSGDTLDKIAVSYGTTANQIATWNKLANKNIIQVGQKLIVQQGTTTEDTVTNEEQLEEIEKKQTPKEFINSIASAAKEVAGNHNLYASVMIAQASLESGYGKSSLSLAPNHNMFGIKGSYNGQSVTMYTNEYSNGKWIRIPQDFKKYPNYQASFEDNARLLRNGLSWSRQFYSGTWIENTTSYRDATKWLEGRYATDPTYAAKLNNIIGLYNLTQYDSVKSPEKPIEVPTTPEEKPEVPTGETIAHKVVSGDSLSRLAATYKTTINAIKSYNNLQSDTIYIGATLQIPVANIETPNQTEPEVPVEKPEIPNENQEGSIGISYTVKSGDTLSQIAARYDTTVSTIKTMNKLSS
ncbi:LysM peptidoglycan-binding domain-containing protein, partial [Lacticigenium naphthae]|uniref:LysM peptidoglycan-binding domain-containing protein n=1 Tax=Lacticigenium naphthae TaxID=515351 RepID=UPI0012ECA01A